MPELKHIKTFEANENLISVAQYCDKIVVCTDLGIYILTDDNKLKPVEMICEESNDQETHSKTESR